MLQELHVEALQPEQELPPTGADIPLSSVVKQANLDSTRSASLLQRGQGKGSVAQLTGRIFSNLVSQSAQTYSYIGIFPLHLKSSPSAPVSQASALGQYISDR